MQTRLRTALRERGRAARVASPYCGDHDLDGVPQTPYAQQVARYVRSTLTGRVNIKCERCGAGIPDAPAIRQYCDACRSAIKREYARMRRAQRPHDPDTNIAPKTIRTVCARLARNPHADRPMLARYTGRSLRTVERVQSWCRRHGVNPRDLTAVETALAVSGMEYAV